ncbi:MAG: type I restriction-modification enzyme R subunit C-terminal domain-containing protein [Planctomycetota bacterium]|nr:type I restriction-modification enzyme R subunit C-terminal domain-containing protein [Planctomycetota bacterium]
MRLPDHNGCAIAEYPTEAGPADYALCVDGRILAIVEAKKLGLGPQNVLTQSERYSRGLTDSPLDFDGFHAPFLYSTNGEVIWFHDVRHAMNRSRRISHFHTPNALREMLQDDFDSACQRLVATPNSHPFLRPYQIQANTETEKAIASRKRQMLLAMATGTGKTVTMVSQICRLMETGVAKRILFLVDRRALAAQAVRTMASFEAKPGLKFDKLFEVYSQRFFREDFADEPFDPKVLPASYLLDPKPGHAFVYVSTIQRMAINLFGRNAIFGIGDEELDEDADKLDIPIHAFDAVIADECHRGYTTKELSVWRNTLDHFDAVKIGLTATPAAHTKAYFKDVVFRYSYEQAVREGYLVDYDVVAIHSDVRMKGIFLKEGEHVDVVDPQTGLERMDVLEAEREFDATEVERRVTSPDSNRKIVEEIKQHALKHEQLTGRLPKALIFAANDLPHTSHADRLVDMCRDIFGRGDSFVQKITGRADRPIQRIREFRNRPDPGMVVSVDLMSTGVDIPDLEYIVFLRPVKSRILFEQMMGRGTRKGEKFPDKSHFTVFDCFGGTLIEYFRQCTGITAEPPEQVSKSVVELIDDIWNNRDREYATRCLVKRLQRINKEMSAAARDGFAAFVPDGDLAGFARDLPNKLVGDFTGTMKLLRDKDFQRLLQTFRRTRQDFLVAYETKDEVRSRYLMRDVFGNELKPDDYLEAFASFVKENVNKIEAIAILLDRPAEWCTNALKELRANLTGLGRRFTVDSLQRAHEMQYHKALVDIISMVKHAAREEAPLLTAEERVQAAMTRVSRGQTFTPEQQQWLDRIREHLIQNLSIEREDFEVVPVLARHGGWAPANRAFGLKLAEIIRQINEAIAA